MNRSRSCRLHDKPDESGQAMVEFALVVPIVLALLFGVITICFLGFQNSSLHNAASAGSREASIETSLLTPTGGEYCESGQPEAIEQAVVHAAVGLPVNTAPLCATSQSATQLTQTPNVANQVNITVTCVDNCATPTDVNVTVSYNAQGITFTDPMTASSQTPVMGP
ncbi:MAG: TadE/TadG family type IV pilus assembly protein [Acidimicrobiia bacterium]